jgi:replicative DNA helicase
MSAAPIDYTRTENPEQAVLGSVMLQPAVLGTLAPMLEPGDFARPAYGQIFSAMQALDARGSAVDPVTRGEELERRGELAAVGGMAFLGVLLDVVPSAANVVYYAELVRNAAQRRALSKTFDDAAALARRGPGADDDRRRRAYRTAALRARERNRSPSLRALR